MSFNINIEAELPADFISKKELMGLVEPHLTEYITKDTYPLLILDPVKLLHHDRFDLAIKVCSERLVDLGCSYGNDLYSKHICAFSEGMFVEPGDQKKISLKDFVETFKELKREIKAHGFDCKKSIIPVSNSLRLLNGAHRVSASILCSENIYAVPLPVSEPCYDYKFFLDKGMKADDLEVAVQEFLKISKDSYIAIVWSAATGGDSFLEEQFKNIVYQKEVSLTSLGKHNLISEVYKGAKWLGNIDNSFSGAWGKINECFGSSGKIRVYVFQSESLSEVRRIKDNIRSHFGIGNSSVHITDTKSEAEELGKMLLNNNSINFINYGSPVKYKSIYKSIENTKKYLISNNIDSELMVFDSGIVLSLYGLRETNDIDVLSMVDVDSPLFDQHDAQIIYHKKCKEDLIFDQKNFFYFNGLKFLSLPLVKSFKASRKGAKDLDDIILIDNMKRNKSFIPRIDKNSFVYTRAKIKIFFRSNFKKSLRKLGLFGIFKKIYCYIK